MSKTVRRSVKVKALLVATAGAAVVVFGANCGYTSGNLVAPPVCGADAGPPGCVDGTVQQDAGNDDGGQGGDR